MKQVLFFLLILPFLSRAEIGTYDERVAVAKEFIQDFLKDYSDRSRGARLHLLSETVTLRVIDSFARSVGNMIFLGEYHVEEVFYQIYDFNTRRITTSTAVLSVVSGSFAERISPTAKYQRRVPRWHANFDPSSQRLSGLYVKNPIPLIWMDELF